MRKKFFSYGEKTSESIYKKLSKAEKQTLENFKDYLLISASLERSTEAQREILRFREITGVFLDKITLEDLRYFLKELKASEFADNTKNKSKGYVQRFLRWNFKDWSSRFDNFEDVKYNSDAQRKKPITSKTILTKEEIEKIMKTEPMLFWKTFFIVQYMGGLRTGETRKLKWSDVSFDDDDFSFIKVSSKKNKNATAKIREIPLGPDATYYLRELKQEQKNKELVTEWVFPSPTDPKEHISKFVNQWFKELTKKAIGREINNYICRHTRGTELKRLIKEGGMSKDNATEFLGHSERMFDKVYSHMDKEDVKQLMKKQIYSFEQVPPEQKNEIKKLKEDMNLQSKELAQSQVYNSLFSKYFLGQITKKELEEEILSFQEAKKIINKR